MKARDHRSLTLAGVLALTAVGASTPALAQPGGDLPPVTLRLGTLEPLASDNGRLMITFAESVEAVPEADLTIELVAEAQLDGGSGSPEHSVVRQLASGTLDMALVPSRGWDEASVRSLHVLQTPMLIDNDALADAVAVDAVGRAILDGMATAGFHGLTFWPSELRHPVAYDCTGREFRRPEDMAGLRIRSVPSTMSQLVLEALGAEPVFTGPYSNHDCGLGGHEAGLSDSWDRLPMTVTGNVVLFPRFHVLAIRDEVFAELTDLQRRTIESAAMGARDAAIKGRARDDELGALQCFQYGNRVIEAGGADLEAWAAAVSPIITMLLEDPRTGPFVTTIQESKRRVAATPLASACEPGARPTSEPSARGWAFGLPPDGTYRMELTQAQLDAAGEPGVGLRDFVGVNTLTIRHPDWRLDVGAGAVGEPECKGRSSLTTGGLWHTEWESMPLCGGFADFRWRVDDVTLVLDLVNSNAPDIDSVWFETNPWQRID